jgi:hypothetical protein
MPQVQQGATPQTYNAFVESAREALRAGDAAKAYSNCEAAREMDASRFEAYVVCAGALSLSCENSIRHHAALLSKLYS